MKTNLYSLFIPALLLFAGLFFKAPEKIHDNARITFYPVKSSHINPKVLTKFREIHPEIYQALKPRDNVLYSGKEFALLKSEKITMVVHIKNLLEKNRLGSISFEAKYFTDVASHLDGLVKPVCSCDGPSRDCAMAYNGTCRSILDKCSDCDITMEYFGLARYFDLATGQRL